MVFGSTTERKLFLLLIGLFSLVVLFVIPTIYTINNYILSFLIFSSVYAFIVSKYVLKTNGKITLAFILIVFAFDIVMPPYLVTATGLASTDPNALVSTDVFVYSILPQSIPQNINYYLTYVFIPVLMLFIARALVNKGSFNNLIKGGL